MQTRQKANPVIVSFQLGVLGLFVIAGFNYQTILDEYALATFQPTSEIQGIENRISLTRQARAMFYRAEPQVDNKNRFNDDCETQSHELELGCYYRGHIYVLRIDNPSLASEMDVVAAHELLHAAWAKMDAAERRALGIELERVYAQIADEELKQRMSGYARSEPGEETNELHSILATEYKNLSPMLEQHFNKFFTDRTKIVNAHERYESVFDVRRLELENELSAIRAQKGELGVLNRQLESFRSRGQIESYNALVPRQNKLVDDINRRIEAYRLAVEEYNALSQSLDSQEITETELPAQ